MNNSTNAVGKHFNDIYKKMIRPHITKPGVTDKYQGAFRTHRADNPKKLNKGAVPSSAVRSHSIS